MAGSSVIDVPEDDLNLVEEELGPGHVVIPDVYVRFTQLASDAPPPSRGVLMAYVRHCLSS